MGEVRETAQQQGRINQIIDGIAGIFKPIINLLSAAGILKGVLVILLTGGFLSETADAYLVLNAMADSLFYFLPILLAYTAAKKFGTDPFLAVVIAGILLYPSLTAVFEQGKTIFFVGLPIRAVIYKSSVIPIILAVALLTYVERFLNKHLPDLVKGFLTPLICIFLIGLMTLFVFGPIGAVVGDLMANAYEAVYQISPVLSGLVLGALIQIMVIFGIHWSFILIAMNNITVIGEDTILALIGPSVYAQAGAALAVFLKSKQRPVRSLCLSSALSACFGVTEPAMFGINLPLKKPMIAVCLGGGIGGVLAGLSGAKAMTFALPSLATLPVFWGDGFWLYVSGCGVAFVIAFVVTYLWRFDVDLAISLENPKAEGSTEPRE